MVADTFDCDYLPGWIPAGDEQLIGFRPFYLFIILKINASVTFMRPNKSNKESILAITLLMLLLYYFTRNSWFIHIAAAVIIVSLLIPGVALLLDKFWNFITSVLGRFSSNLLLSVIFFAVLLPWGLLLRLFGKEMLPIKLGGRSTTFSIRNKTFVNKDLQNPF